MYSTDDNGLGQLGTALLSQNTGTGTGSVIAKMLQTYMLSGMNNPNGTPDPFGLFSGKTVDTSGLGMVQPPLNPNDTWNWGDK